MSVITVIEALDREKMKFFLIDIFIIYYLINGGLPYLSILLIVYYVIYNTITISWTTRPTYIISTNLPYI